MFTKVATISALVAIAQARFGQEQVPVSAVTALSNFGNPGEAATLAGGIPGSLLAAADPCAKLTLADKIVSTLGTDAAVISAAQQLVAAEQNFNPFVVSIPNICGDATLPATEELRGIVPLVDPAVTGSDAENANSASSLNSPFDATGLSVAEVMIAQGFSNFSVNGQDQSSGSTGNTDTGSAATTTAAAASTTLTKCSKNTATASAATTSAAAASSTASATQAADAAATSAASSAATGAGAVADPVTGTCKFSNIPTVPQNSTYTDNSLQSMVSRLPLSVLTLEPALLLSSLRSRSMDARLASSPSRPRTPL